MELELRQNFYDYFDEHRHKSYDNSLLFQMGAFDRKVGMPFLFINGNIKKYK